MIKNLLLIILLTTTIFTYEIVLDESLTQKEINHIYKLMNPKSNFIFIKSGSFLMGSNDGDNDEKPIHKVTIPYDFYISKYEVTVGEFKKFIEDTNYKVDSYANGGCSVYDNGWKKTLNASWKNPHFPQTNKSPVVCVSNNDAKAYTKWLSKKDKKTYRLPTEAEWEYVAKTEIIKEHNFLDYYAWYSSTSNGKTHKVGQKKPNSWGLYDMQGNVWEWCEDWYVSSYNNTPNNGTANYNGSKKYKIIRGGSWVNGGNYLRLASRDRYTKSNADFSIGFRIILENH